MANMWRSGMQKKTEMNLIFFYRIIFTYAIVFFHFDCGYGLLSDLGLVNGLYIATDFFFIVSGYLLYKSFLGNPDKYKNGAAYTFSRIKSLLPMYWISYFLIILFRMYRDGVRITIYYVITHFFELFALQGIGLNMGWTWMNNSMWFISVMLLSGFIIYELLKRKHEIFVNLLAPIIIVVCISIIYRNVGSLSASTQTDGLWINYSFARGLMEMCLGIYAYKLTEVIKERGKNLLLYKLASLFLAIIVLVLSTIVQESKADFLLLLMEFVMVSFGFIPININDRIAGFVCKWSALTANIYMLHMLIVDYIIPHFSNGNNNVGEKAKLLLFGFIVTTILACLIQFVTNKFKVKKI